jgi:hypothetical protein
MSRFCAVDYAAGESAAANTIKSTVHDLSCVMKAPFSAPILPEVLVKVERAQLAPASCVLGCYREVGSNAIVRMPLCTSALAFGSRRNF